MQRKSASMPKRIRFPHLGFTMLILFYLLVGGMTYQAYGASWDEPEFYKYAAAVPYAYSIQAHLSGQFDVRKSFGPLPDAHKMYGPAYLLIGDSLVNILTSAFHVSWYASWHLVNFLSFQAGIVFFYLLCLRWLSKQAAFATTLLFSTQPILWGHGFINPKDIPFMSFFLAALYLGFWGMDRLGKTDHLPSKLSSRVINIILFVLPAGIAAGLLVSIRILGPFVVLLVALYAFFKYGFRSIPGILVLGLITILVSYLTWPFLWGNPIQHFQEVLEYMADNPVILSVLFQGKFFRSNNLPFTYLPVTLWISFTEVVWALFFLGGVAIFWKKYFKQVDWHSLIWVFVWFFLPFCYVVIFRPALYDGLRHFIFILPPVFIIAGFAIERLFMMIQKNWLKVLLMAVLIFPGVYGIFRLYPYEYTYYNAFIGGTGGAFRSFETDFWLTCYKEAMQKIHAARPEAKTVYVFRNAQLAGQYANPGIKVVDLSLLNEKVPQGGIMLFTTRFNDDLNVHYYDPLFLSVGREAAEFCIVREAEK